MHTHVHIQHAPHARSCSLIGWLALCVVPAGCSGQPHATAATASAVGEPAAPVADASASPTFLPPQSQPAASQTVIEAPEPWDGEDAGAMPSSKMTGELVTQTASVLISKGVVTKSTYQVFVSGVCMGDCAMGPQTVWSLVRDSVSGLIDCFHINKTRSGTVVLTMSLSQQGNVLHPTIRGADQPQAQCLLRVFRRAQLPAGSDPNAKYTFTFDIRFKKSISP